LGVAPELVGRVLARYRATLETIGSGR
jgi:hypothetical protein